jgi:hypothetical protein
MRGGEALKEVQEYLKLTDIIQCDNVMIQEKAEQVTTGEEDGVEKQSAYFALCQMRLRIILSFQDT